MVRNGGVWMRFSPPWRRSPAPSRTSAIEIRHHHLPGEGVSIVEYTFSGTHEGELEGVLPTGRTMEVVACSVAEIHDGQIHRERDYYDTLVLMRQLGLADPA
jgi:ketosteroid isomerase-like protein